MTQGRCPVCGTQAQLLGPVADFADTDAIECPRCGRFLISGTVRVVLENLVQRRAINSSRLSHVLRLRYDARRLPPPFLRQVSDIQPYQDDPTHTSPQEQIRFPQIGGCLQALCGKHRREGGLGKSAALHRAGILLIRAAPARCL